MKLWLLFLIPLCLFGDEFKQHINKNDWNYVKTPEDKKRLGFFSSLYEMAQKRDRPVGAIPQTLHFIWLGPRPFPSDSVKNVKGWIDAHPGWKVKFWTDLGLAAPDDRMEVRTIDAFPLQELKECFFKSDNYGERSQLLRYTVLLSEGGIYIDHDAVCVKTLSPFQENYDFFCGMEVLGETVLSSSVNPSPHLIGASQGHPILLCAKKWLKAEWDRLEAQYPGSQPQEVRNRVLHRTFSALSIGLKQAPCRAGRKDAVFPPDYFSLAKNGVYATHRHAATWNTPPRPHDSKVDALTYEANQTSSRTLLFVSIAAVLNAGLVGYVFFKKLRRG